MPPNIADNRFLNPWIIVHAGAAATALLLGPAQFLPAAAVVHDPSLDSEYMWLAP